MANHHHRQKQIRNDTFCTADSAEALTPSTTRRARPIRQLANSPIRQLGTLGRNRDVRRMGKTAVAREFALRRPESYWPGVVAFAVKVLRSGRGAGGARDISEGRGCARALRTIWWVWIVEDVGGFLFGNILCLISCVSFFFSDWRMVILCEMNVWGVLWVLYWRLGFLIKF